MTRRDLVAIARRARARGSVLFYLVEYPPAGWISVVVPSS